MIENIFLILSEKMLSIKVLTVKTIHIKNNNYKNNIKNHYFTYYILFTFVL